ncbi:putative endonuclease lcl3 [Erysiphe necator]|uniref:Probable endonuclease LCL3 n=1 Tax=Uncinula necator TaxID=52586 RepID=A0A0B1PHD5_UNCNE|nr:putative endonuclease lcl3 [Erysiphe necator]KHJ35954.1 putative nuclease domain containing protein [Erysiphe necator]
MVKWPPWSEREADKKNSILWLDNLNTTNWDHYTDPRTIVPTVLLTTVILVSSRIHRTYLRRIPEAKYISPRFFRNRSLFGTVTRVGDADNFHLFHTPGGRLTGWGWFPGRKVPENKMKLRGNTIHIRLAGIDAPELAHWGKPGQQYSVEALAWLEKYIGNRRVRAYIHKKDQYERIVATVWIRRFLLRRDVGKEMLKAGWATLYEAKTGAEFGGFEQEYRKAEEMAKLKKVGIWVRNTKATESPREYKRRISSTKNL